MTKKWVVKSETFSYSSSRCIQGQCRLPHWVPGLDYLNLRKLASDTRYEIVCIILFVLPP